MAGRVVFHLTTRSEWEAAEVSGRYRAPSLESEGFIHCSNLDQLERVAQTLFAGAIDLVALAIDADRLDAGSPMRDEPGVHGCDERFPHVYGPIPVDAVISAVPLAPPGRDD